jgi:hypothetical protein
LLPPVLLHLSLEGHMRAVIVAGYILAFIAVGMHCADALGSGGRYRAAALLLITIGFVVLTATAATGIALQEGIRKRGKTSRVLASMCLLLFAMSFVHFGTGHPLHAWSSEVALHHGGIPLALFILMQDYRFVLLDAFLRFLANALLAGALTVLGVEIAIGLHLMKPAESAQDAILIAGIGALLVVFAMLRTLVQRWLTEAVFRRPPLDTFLQKMRRKSDSVTGEPQFLSWAAAEVAAFMKAGRWELVTGDQFSRVFDKPDLLFPVPVDDTPSLRNLQHYRWAEAIVPLRLPLGETRYLLLGRRQGGRRYLSEDLRILGRIAAQIAEQMEQYREAEMQRLVAQAELRALQSQINPHFLFNALNTLYGIIPRDASGARKTLVNLAEIFRYFLQSPDRFIRLSEEIQIVKAYLEIEKLRLGSRLNVVIQVDDEASAAEIPILSIQPLVENAVKHGVSANSEPGTVTILAKAGASSVIISIEDTGSGPYARTGDLMSGAGVGLENVKKRLQLCYGPSSELKFRCGPNGTRVEFSVPLNSTPTAAPVLHHLAT